MGDRFRPLRDWCYTCCTDHTTTEPCPGNLQATGDERHGWRALVATPFGHEIYGVLVAPTRGSWRARIVTYPNILWILPDGGSIKFVGDDARGAEKKAIAFIRHHCQLRGLTIQKRKLPLTDSGAIDPEADPAIAAALGGSSNSRKVLGFPLRFGIGHVVHPGSTDNLSEGGMFVRTDAPLPEKSPVQIELEADGLRIPLKGVVKWVREGAESGRPNGMGVELLRPPPRYLHFVRQRLKIDRDKALLEPARAQTPRVDPQVETEETADPAAVRPS
jgi:hypothetical protein